MNADNMHKIVLDVLQDTVAKIPNSLKPDLPEGKIYIGHQIISLKFAHVTN